MRSALRIIAACLLVIPWGVHGQELGVRGNTWPIGEADMIDMVKGRLSKLEREGKIAEFYEKARASTLSKLKNPPPIPGIAKATSSRTRTFDPTYTVAESVRDHAGNLVVPAGFRVNPLDHIRLTKLLVFIDGRDPRQVEFAQKQVAQNPRNKVILVGGSWLDLSRKLKRQVYYDQNATLVTRLQISRVPSLVRQKDRLLIIEEMAL